MPDPIITNNDIGNVILKDVELRDGLLTFAGAGTVIEGTILARDSVSESFVPYVKGGATNENGIPKAVISYDVIAAGAGDVPIRAIVSGVVRENRLIIDADASNVNVDEVVLDELRSYAIVTLGVQELNILDNQ